jgi:hypothetical protein
MAGSSSGNPNELQVIDAKNLMICTGCPAPQVLTVTSTKTVNCADQLCATIADCIPMVNIKPFGPCAFTPAPPSPSGGPCVPAPVGKWQPGSAMTTHEDNPALRKSDTLPCALGGTISIAVPGQTKTFVG